MTISISRGLMLGAFVAAALISGCAANQKAAVRDDIEIVQTAPDSVVMTMQHGFYSGGGMHGDWPEERARAAQREFFLVAAEEAQRRGKPGFRVTDLDSDGRHHSKTDGFRMYDIKTELRMSATVEFLDQAPEGREDGVYVTSEALGLFGA